MRKSIFTTTLFFLSLSLLGQKPQFDCPCKQGKIVEYFYSTEVAKKPGAEIQAKNIRVYNILGGEVVDIDTVKGDIRVYIRSGDFFFSFHGLGDVNVTKGQAVNERQQLGNLLARKNLFLIMSFKDNLVEPSDFLKCRKTKVYL